MPMRFPTLVTYSWDVDNLYKKIGLCCGVVDRYRFDADPDSDHILCFDADVKKVTQIGSAGIMIPIPSSHRIRIHKTDKENHFFCHFEKELCREVRREKGTYVKTSSLIIKCTRNLC